MLFDGSETLKLVDSQELAIKLVTDIELPCSSNAALCYLKLNQYDHVLYYTKGLLEKDPKNYKALYRRGIAFCRLGEVEQAKASFDEAYAVEGLD